MINTVYHFTYEDNLVKAKGLVRDELIIAAKLRFCGFYTTLNESIMGWFVLMN